VILNSNRGYTVASLSSFSN